MPRLLALILLLSTTALAAPRGVSRPGTVANEDIARARAGRNGKSLFPIEPFAPAAFARAKRENRLILVDGAAAWCHWCHVMDETTYRDPAVGQILQARFVVVRFDVDERPDLGDRYESTGWPATILISPEGEELGRYRGFLDADRLKTILEATVQSFDRSDRGTAAASGPAIVPLPVEALGWLGRLSSLALDGGFDEENAGWGRRKFPLPANVLYELSQAARGDARARDRALRTLAAHRRLVDPVWGGIWKGNAERDWTAPHVEKQTIYQGPNLEAFARGYAIARDPALLTAARSIEQYLARFMTSSDGGFFAAQDADVGAHDPAERFVDGVVYYSWPDAKRRRAGLPWIDTHVYARENGLVLAGLAALYEATGDAAVLERARRAARHLIEKTILPDGSVEHDAARATGRFFLTDAAALGLGLARLGRAATDPAFKDAARRIALAIDKNFADPKTGALFDSTLDPDAGGAFARRGTPLDANLWAARLDAAVSADTGDSAFRERGLRAVAAVATPDNIDSLGYLGGELLLALDELGVFPAK